MALNFYKYTPSSELYGEIAPPAPIPKDEPGLLGNLGRAAGSGALSATGGIFDFLGAEGVAKQFYGWSDDARQSMSTEAQQDMAKPFFKEDTQGDITLGEGLADLDTWLLTMASVAGQFAPTAIPGAGIAGAATKALSLGTKGQKVATAAGMGFTGGSAATGQGMEQARQEYLQMPDEIKAQSELFKTTLRQIKADKPDLDADSLWNATDEAIAAKLADDVRKDPATLLANFAGSAIADPVIGKALTGARLAKSGAFRSAAKGFVVEGSTEAAQGGTQQYGINKALSQIDGRDNMQGVAVAALNEGVAGGGFGAVAGGIGGIANRKQPEADPVTDPDADAIRGSNPDLAAAFDSTAQSSAQRQADMEVIGNMLAVSSRPLEGELLPPGMPSTFADNQQPQRRQRPFTPYAGQIENKNIIFGTDNRSYDDRAMQGEYMGPEGQPAFRPAGLLERAAIDAQSEQRKQAQADLERMRNEPRQITDKNVIFAGDNRPQQQAQEFTQNLQREANQAAAVPRLPQKDIIFAGDQSGVTVKGNGAPFQSPKEALSSKSARVAKKAGQTIEAVKFGDGWGWQPTKAPAADLAGEQIDKEWTAFAEDSGTLKIPRAEMPQIKAEHRGAMTQFLKARGISHEQQTVPASELKPTQAEFSPSKVRKAMGYEGGDRSILVSSDGYVLDGHHQWLAKRENGEQLDVIRFDAPISELVQMAREFPSSTVADGATQPTNNKPAKVEATSSTATADAEVSTEKQADLEFPEILRVTKKKYITQQAKKQQLREGSPGYAQAVSKLEEQYEADVDRAQASLTFEQFNDLNKGSPEPVNRQAYVALRKEFGITEGPKFSKSNLKRLDANTIKSKPARRMNMKAAQAAAGKIIKNLSGAAGIKVVVLETQVELEQITKQSLDGTMVRGAYDSGSKTAYVITENLTGLNVLRAVIAHEVLAHGGLDTVIGKDKYNQFIDRLKQTRSNKLFNSLWANIDQDYDGMSEEVKAEELFAYYAQNKPITGPIKFWWNAMKRWLHKALVSVGLAKEGDADLDLMDDMVDSIRAGFILRRGGAKTNSDKSDPAELAFSKTTTAETGTESETAPKQDTRTAKEKLGLEEQARETLAQQTKRRTKETIETLKDQSFWQRMNEGIFDGMIGIKQAEESVGITDPNKQGYVSARLASGLADVLHAVFNYGAPEWRDGVVARKADTKGMLEVFGMLGDDLNNWLAWMGANRAERLMAQGRENNLTKADIAELKALADGKEALFEEVRQEYNKINSAVISLAQEAGLISKEQRGGFDEEWYVPFFRDMDVDPEMEGVAAMVHGPKSKQGMANQSAKIKELKGGKQSTKDLLENIIQRQSTLIDAALKNKAMLEIVENLDGTDFMESVKSADITALSQAELGRLHKVKVMRDGKPEAYAVSDPALLRGLLQINDAGSKSLFNKLARSAKRFLTTGITLSPDFIIKNFVRDATQAWMINKENFTAGVDSIKGIRNAFAESENYRELIFAGSAFQGGYVHGADPEAGAQQIRRALSERGLGSGKIDGYMDSLVTKGAKLFEKYRNASDKLENANRLATYEAALKSGKSKKEAAFIARDLMDFSLKGNFTLIGTMIDMLPFFNARLQGMSKLVRAARAGDGDRVLKVLSANLAMKGMKLAAFSLALAALNEDDERYQELEGWDKDINWHFWIGDDHFRIPKPFELGVMFGTIPERLFNYGTGTQTGSEFAKSMSHAVWNTLALNPMPQLFNPVYEILNNRSSFRDSAIETMADKNKQPGDRYSANTSDIAKLLGGLINSEGFSPKQIEHLVNGYAGTLGMYVLGTADFMARQMMGVEKADIPLSRYPVIKAFYQGDSPKTSTKFQTEFYDALEQSTQAYGSYKRAMEEGDTTKQQELLKDEAKSLGSRVQLSRIQRQVSKLNTQAATVNNNKSLSGAQKRERLDEITRSKNALFQRAFVQYKIGEW